jgi:phage-related protein (TIGR01555 family)
LYGGAVLFIGLSDRRPTEEVKLSSIRKGGLEHVTPLSRKEVFLGELETDPLSKNYGCPKYYIVGAMGGTIKIHPSRIVKFIGNHNGTSGWGESVLVSSYDDIRRATAAADNISNLLFESTINIYKVPNLITSLGAAGKEYEDLILKRFGLTSATKGILGDIVIDKEEDFDRKSTSFAQLPEILEKFWLAVAASEDIPVTRFLGQSPAGLNSTGEGDAQNYLDKLKAIQELDIAPALAGLDEILIRSATGGRDNELGFSWNPIRRADESNLVSLAREEAVMLGTINGLNVFTAEEMRKIAQAVLIARKIPGASEIA